MLGGWQPALGYGVYVLEAKGHLELVVGANTDAACCADEPQPPFRGRRGPHTISPHVGRVSAD